MALNANVISLSLTIVLHSLLAKAVASFLLNRPSLSLSYLSNTALAACLSTKANALFTAFCMDFLRLRTSCSTWPLHWFTRSCTFCSVMRVGFSNSFSSDDLPSSFSSGWLSAFSVSGVASFGLGGIVVGNIFMSAPFSFKNSKHVFALLAASSPNASTGAAARLTSASVRKFPCSSNFALLSASSFTAASATLTSWTKSMNKRLALSAASFCFRMASCLAASSFARCSLTCSTLCEASSRSLSHSACMAACCEPHFSNSAVNCCINSSFMESKFSGVIDRTLWKALRMFITD
mmetsp:Transcript_73546/g.212848  ORF Transcript_73546/g.212848 Transcript_73546/m.212848 type:complete len:293 (-) Transcript_73546:771-1649(-)